LRKANERALSGKPDFNAQGALLADWRAGWLLYPVRPVWFLQSPREVTMIWEEDHMVRHVYLNMPHSRAPKPSWFGESIGHYENGDHAGDRHHRAERQDLCRFLRTPHTTQLHVIERYRLADGAKRSRRASRSKIRARSRKLGRAAALRRVTDATQPNPPARKTTAPGSAIGISNRFRKPHGRFLIHAPRKRTSSTRRNGDILLASIAERYRIGVDGTAELHVHSGLPFAASSAKKFLPPWPLEYEPAAVDRTPSHPRLQQFEFHFSLPVVASSARIAA